jgi:uncharacterized membrane protein
MHAVLAVQVVAISMEVSMAVLMGVVLLLLSLSMIISLDLEVVTKLSPHLTMLSLRIGMSVCSLYLPQTPAHDLNLRL